ncbi:cation:proton antiporter [Halanaerobiaceae bacterium Z-7014]|uniref:Cation:proton antiporter n=1 Tax=Halonatronomonas betaini TaxID=2778430 RepID=A0A931F774_9FIRM|nr:monovalent cation/H+ antiporter complex subunit F [Halonatronomonas betaini]MBF8437665.1 cation:proton antiporter [Halonatronomonas betaini]
MTNNILIFASLLLSILIFLSLIRGIIGPSSLDRIIVINVIGTKTVSIMVLFAIIFSEYYFVDIALVYALISFIASISVAKYLEKGSVS